MHIQRTGVVKITSIRRRCTNHLKLAQGRSPHHLKWLLFSFSFYGPGGISDVCQRRRSEHLRPKTQLYNIAIAMLGIHQDRHWFMRIVHLKGHARPRAWRTGDPPAPRRRHTKPAALALLPRSTEVQPRAYTCMYMHGHGQACGCRKGPRSPGSRMRRAGVPTIPHVAPEMKPGSGAGPGLVPDPGSGTGLNKKRHP